MLLATMLFAGPVLAAPLSMAQPETVGLSSERLANLSNLLKAEVESGRLPGAVLAVARRGQLAHFEAIGFRDPVTRDPMPGDAIFSIASMTKPMVAVAVMMLHEEGKLFLFDPVGKYLPALANMRVATIRTDSDGKSAIETTLAPRQPTIQDLLRHTSGFAYSWSGTTEVHQMWPDGSADSSLEQSGVEFIAMLGKTPLLHEPGTIWDYGVSVDVLGLVVEAVSGKSLGRFLQERVWQPLGMIDTNFWVPDAKRSRYALAFRNDPLTGQPQRVLHALEKPLKFECGGGCAVSTAMDYLRFALMLANKGTLEGRRLLSRKTIELMTSDQLAPEVRARTTSPVLPEGYSFGLGFMVRARTGGAAVAGTIGDFNWAGAYGSSFWVDPQEELTVVFMATAPGALAGQYRALVKNVVLGSIVD
jgi:CubicO group peptidase (beta-lactamase class C family)